MTEHHDERCAQEMHGIFETCEAVIVEEIASKRTTKRSPGHWSKKSSGKTRLSEQPRIAAIGYCASRARPTAEYSLSSRSLAT